MDLKVTLVQSSLFWEDINRNLDQFEEKIEQLTEQTDLIILPEMFTTGFTMDAGSLAEEMTGITMNRLQRWASKANSMIIGSFIAKVSHKYYNRLVCVKPDGSFDSYDKRHLFSLANEGAVFSPGTEKLIIEWRKWKICPMICYDLRFPGWSRNGMDNAGIPEYDLLIYVANWPDKRNYAWNHLTIARAIENQSYVAGVNRVGVDGKDFSYTGDSCLIDPMGKVLYSKSDEEDVSTHILSYSQLHDIRSRLQFLKDADELEFAGF